jgi:(p)ppGpp synthase/HD superfamily hydrolase
MSEVDKILSPLFEEALLFASKAHASQMRKSSDVPYIAHILGVTALVLEDGGSETEAIAALLHDAAEDQGGNEMLETIRLKFGEKVAQIVLECSDTLETPKPDWKKRKRNHLDSLQNALPETIRIIMADKLYNSRTLLRGLHEHGSSIWKNFNGDRDGTLWYYKQMLVLLREKIDSSQLIELEKNILEIEKIA